MRVAEQLEGQAGDRLTLPGGSVRIRQSDFQTQSAPARLTGRLRPGVADLLPLFEQVAMQHASVVFGCCFQVASALAPSTEEPGHGEPGLAQPGVVRRQRAEVLPRERVSVGVSVESRDQELLIAAGLAAH
jgi:hypothetical protein